MSLEPPEGAAGEDTAQLAGEIEDLIFKVCSDCHVAYGGDLEVCPADGTRLSEPSLHTRETLIFGSGEAYGNVSQLRKYCPRCRSGFSLHLKVCPSCGSALVIPTLGGSSVQRDPKDHPAGQPGLLIAEKYRVLKDIGSGGFGNVYLVKHESLGKRYAVKVLRGQLAERTNFRDRFHEEALKLSRLEDENIVKVIDFGEWNEHQYMVTEYVEGQDLSALIYGGRVAPLRAARIMHQVAGAMAEAHSKQIVHLDLKPANILVSDKRGRDLVKVIDFGLAEIYSDVKAGRQRKVAGTCSYMAPEQWRKSPLDPRTDIYSFGVIFYELLAGRPPFRHAQVSELERAHCQTPPAPLRKLRPDVPSDLDRLIHRCLEKEPGKRFSSADRLEEALQGYLQKSENALARWVKRVAAAAAALLVLGAGGFGLVESLRDRVGPRWVEVRVSGGELKESPRSSFLDRHYLTLESKFQLHLKAVDDRSAPVFRVISDVLEERGPYTPDQLPLELELPLGPTVVTAEALDEAGMRSESVRLHFVRFPPVGVRVRADRLPECTGRDQVELEFEALADGKARVVCSNGGERTFETEVERLTDGSFRLSAPDASGRSEYAAEPPLRLKIPVRPGDNEIRVSEINLLGEEKPGPEAMRVAVIASPLSASAEVEVKEPGKLLGPGAVGEWLTSSDQMSLVVRVDDAKRRIAKGSMLRYRIGAREPLGNEWSDGEIERGWKAIEQVALPVDGRYDIAVEVVDRCGSAARTIPLVVVRDRQGPRVVLRESTVEFKRSHGDSPPPITFEVADDHPATAGEAIGIADAATGKLLDHDSLELRQGEAGRWEVRIRPALLRTKETHELAVIARDRVGNASISSSGRFTIHADRSPPRLTVQGPRAEEEFTRGQDLRLRVRVTNDRPEGMEVKARVTVPLVHSRKTEKEFPLLHDGDANEWAATIPLGRGNGLSKPQLFDRLDPGFDVVITAVDRSGNESEPLPLRFRYRWERGDQLQSRTDGSVLVYHPECGSMDVPGPFFLAKTEVTNRQFSRFIEARGGPSEPLPHDWNRDQGQFPADRLDLPVRGVSWSQVLEYCAWARLNPPRRAEWLAAAFWDYTPGKGKGRAFAWDGSWPPETPVWAGGEKSPAPALVREGKLLRGRTPQGLHHMLGNVWELVEDQATGRIVRVGGGFETDIRIFSSEEIKHRKYLQGDPGQERGLAPGEGSYTAGFRPMLDLDGSKP